MLAYFFDQDNNICMSKNDGIKSNPFMHRDGTKPEAFTQDGRRIDPEVQQLLDRAAAKRARKARNIQAKDQRYAPQRSQPIEVYQRPEDRLGLGSMNFWRPISYAEKIATPNRDWKYPSMIEILGIYPHTTEAIDAWKGFTTSNRILGVKLTIEKADHASVPKLLTALDDIGVAREMWMSFGYSGKNRFSTALAGALVENNVGIRALDNPYDSLHYEVYPLDITSRIGGVLSIVNQRYAIDNIQSAP